MKIMEIYMQKTIKYSLITVALLSQLHANNQYTLDTINVTASQGTILDKKNITDSVKIITKEAIKESRVTTLDEALNKLGGISITQNGGIGKNTSVFLRGMDTRRLLVLIDDVRYNNPSSLKSTADFSQILLYNVEQIEIIKGSQSGIWGSDASGGVINIITSKAKKGFHSIANLEYGSYDSIKTSLQTSYAIDKFDLLIGGLLYSTDGFSAVEPKLSEANYKKRYDELGLEKDLYKNRSLNVKIGYDLTQNDRVEASIQSIDSNIDFDSFSGSAGDSDIPNTKIKNRFYNFAYSHKNSLHDIKLNYNLSTFDQDTLGNGWDAQYVGSINEIKIDDKISYMQDSFLKAGISYQKFKSEKVTANEEDKEYDSISIFATNYNMIKLFSDSNTIITESLRYDRYDEFDNSLTGKIGIKQFIDNNFYISANIGTGYNVPTMSQLYNQYWGDDTLKPEKSLTSDITIGNNTIWITGFYNEITDLIDYNYTTWKYSQFDGVSKFRGIEIGYEDYFLDKIGVNAMYTYVKTEDADGESLARRPKVQVDMSATYYLSDGFDLGLNAQYIGTRYDSANEQGAQTGKYTVVNFVTNIKIDNSITVYAKIDNITDKYYQSVDGYATAGRSLYLGLNASY